MTEQVQIEVKSESPRLSDRHRRLLETRYDVPFVPVNTVPDWAVTFLLNSGQSESINLPQDVQLFMITANNSGGLLFSPNGKPPSPATLVTAESVTAGANINTDSLSFGVVNPVNILFDGVGVSSIGLLSYGTSNLVSIWGWKNVE